MKNIILAVSALFILAAADAVAAKPLSVRMVESEMVRFPRATALDFSKKAKWTYTIGLELHAMLDVYDRYQDAGIWDYALHYADTMINDRGEILTYRKEDFNVDMIAPGRILFRIHDRTGDPKYKKAMDLLRSQLEEQPRTASNVFWHKKIYPYQVWLDGLYMAQPYFAEYTLRYNCCKEQAYIFKDIANQFVETAKRTYDPATGLYRHAWEETRQQSWSDPVTGQSPCVWGRAMGWYVMAIVDALDHIPASTEGRSEMIEILRGIYDVLPKYRDPETGMWFQVVDQGGREGNYVEATSSAMFTYAMLKAVRQGYIDPSRLPEAVENYENLVKTFVREEPDGTISLTNCCQVAGLGGKTNRSGTFEYYMSEPVIDNDPKGTGPFVLASLEYEALQQEKGKKK